MDSYEAGQKVQIRRNVGNIGGQWVDGTYIGLDELHVVRVTGDYQEIVLGDDDVVRPKPITAKHVQTITVIDPDTKLPCEMDIFKTEDGVLVGLDGAYLEDIGGTSDNPWYPYRGNTKLIIPED